MSLEQSVLEAVKVAIDTCDLENEEMGGVILYKGDTAEFVQLDNMHRGTPTALVLFEPDPDDYGHRVVTRTMDGWRCYGSFHTHPSFSPMYSIVDYKELFPSFKTNFIHSIAAKQTMRYDWMEDRETLIRTEVLTDGRN